MDSIIIPPEILVYMGAITMIVEVLKKFVPAISTASWIPRIISLLLGIGAGLLAENINETKTGGAAQ